jgi:transposase
LLGGQTVDVGSRGFSAALDWVRGLGSERAWALEDCRHVSDAFARFLVVHGERVVRAATRLMVGAGSCHPCESTCTPPWRPVAGD